MRRLTWSLGNYQKRWCCLPQPEGLATWKWSMTARAFLKARGLLPTWFVFNGRAEASKQVWTPGQSRHTQDKRHIDVMALVPKSDNTPSHWFESLRKIEKTWQKSCITELYNGFFQDIWRSDSNATHCNSQVKHNFHIDISPCENPNSYCELQHLQDAPKTEPSISKVQNMTTKVSFGASSWNLYGALKISGTCES